MIQSLFPLFPLSHCFRVKEQRNTKQSRVLHPIGSVSSSMHGSAVPPRLSECVCGPCHPLVEDHDLRYANYIDDGTDNFLREKINNNIIKEDQPKRRWSKLRSEKQNFIDKQNRKNKSFCFVLFFFWGGGVQTQQSHEPGSITDFDSIRIVI